MNRYENLGIYNPGEIEQKWYHYWEENGVFHDEPEEGKEGYSIVLPPPNVTGQLHMGHALDGTLQDILIRYKRMQGYNVLWLPGKDHAGIATQVKVEKEIAKEGLTKYDLGTGKISGKGLAVEGKIRRHHRAADPAPRLFLRLEQGRFTMDDVCARAVREVLLSSMKS